MAIVVRRVRESDKDRVMAIAAKTWRGHDYIPRVWDEWLADNQGVFLSLEVDGVVSALAKVTIQGPGEIWLEGLRVAWDMQGKGYGKMLNDYVLWYLKRLNPTQIAFVTADVSKASIHIGKKSGYVVLNEYIIYQSKPRSSLAQWDEGLVLEDIGEVYDYITESEELARLHGFITYGWSCRKIKRYLVEDFVGQGFAWGVRGDSGLRSLMLVHSSPFLKLLLVSFLAGEEGDFPRLFAMLHHSARKGGYKTTACFDALGKLGGLRRRLKLRRPWGFKSVILFSLPIFRWRENLPQFEEGATALEGEDV